MAQKGSQKVIVYPSRRLTNDQEHNSVKSIKEIQPEYTLPSNIILNHYTPGQVKVLKETNIKTYDEKENLKEQLDIQLKINGDLKKLLVASIGDDLHNKVEALIRTKAQLSSEINTYTSKLLEDYESIDKLSILVDMWYSKFQASKLLVSQLTSDRDALLNLYLQSKNALQYAIDERQYLYNILADTNRLLLESKNKLIECNEADTSIMNTLELAEFNKVLVELLYPINSSICSTTVPSRYTYAEALANEVIKAESTIMLPQNEKLHPRFHPKTKYYGVTFNCCKKCSGNVLIV